MSWFQANAIYFCGLGYLKTETECMMVLSAFKCQWTWFVFYTVLQYKEWLGVYHRCHGEKEFRVESFGYRSKTVDFHWLQKLLCPLYSWWGEEIKLLALLSWFFFCYLGKIDTVRNFSSIFNQQYTGEKVLTFTHCSEWGAFFKRRTYVWYLMLFFWMCYKPLSLMLL